jgi:transcriptional regulator with XRE-family HTH domain
MQQHPVGGLRDDTEMNFGDRLREARELRKMTRTELAKASGVGYSTICEMENTGQRTTGKIVPLARALNVREEWLAAGSGERDRPPEKAASHDWADVRGFAQSAGLGTGAEANEYAEAHSLKFKRQLLFYLFDVLHAA